MTDIDMIREAKDWLQNTTFANAYGDNRDAEKMIDTIVQALSRIEQPHWGSPEWLKQNPLPVVEGDALRWVRKYGVYDCDGKAMPPQGVAEIEAALSRGECAVGDGFALVPIEPTEQILNNMEEQYMPFGEMSAAYDAMLSAAPKVDNNGELSNQIYTAKNPPKPTEGDRYD